MDLPCISIRNSEHFQRTGRALLEGVDLPAQTTRGEKVLQSRPRTTSRQHDFHVFHFQSYLRRFTGRYFETVSYWVKAGRRGGLCMAAYHESTLLYTSNTNQSQNGKHH